ncbi:MAG TPA: 2-amino-4-hydroxy-6-hydroxymethyldihydropteridine diphosphokinase, partial [Fervidobacterium sp.]|nr:2-amino-4-hydroxy-6-hydroxymethyldihydropteridine diphosphokinase [Fervidobacterium sp.]
NIKMALEMIEGFAQILNVSNIYETKPYGKTDQPDFLNCVVEIDTTLDPQMLLDRLLAVENEMGRIRAEKWGPRVLDLDILFYGNLIVENDHLELPHYDFENRMFFVQPMCDLNKNFIHPLSQRTMEDIFKSLAQNS